MYGINGIINEWHLLESGEIHVSVVAAAFVKEKKTLSDNGGDAKYKDHICTGTPFMPYVRSI